MPEVLRNGSLLIDTPDISGVYDTFLGSVVVDLSEIKPDESVQRVHLTFLDITKKVENGNEIPITRSIEVSHIGRGRTQLPRNLFPGGQSDQSDFLSVRLHEPIRKSVGTKEINGKRQVVSEVNPYWRKRV